MVGRGGEKLEGKRNKWEEGEKEREVGRGRDSSTGRDGWGGGEVRGGGGGGARS